MFKLDSPFMNFLNKVCDIMILNILVLVCSIPVFTAGAAITAAYYMSYKMVKNEETYILKGFFKSFKENFRQSTIMWLMMIVVAAILFTDYKILTSESIEANAGLGVAIMIVALIVVLGATFIFPLQARFCNSIKSTIKNAYLMSIMHVPSSILFVISLAVPVLLIYMFPQIAPAIALLAFGAIIYGKSFLYLRIFQKYEEQMLANGQAAGQEPSESEDSGIFATSEAMEKASEEEKKANKSKKKFFH